MGAAVISKLESIQLVYVRMRMGRVSSISHAAVVVELRGHMKQAIRRMLQ